MRRKIHCFAYGELSDVQQQQDVKSRRTAEESRTRWHSEASTVVTGCSADNVYGVKVTKVFCWNVSSWSSTCQVFLRYGWYHPLDVLLLWSPTITKLSQLQYLVALTAFVVFKNFFELLKFKKWKHRRSRSMNWKLKFCKFLPAKLMGNKVGVRWSTQIIPEQ